MPSTPGIPADARRREHRDSRLYFVRVHVLRKRKSSLLIGVSEDAAIVVRQITKAYSVSR
jgi:hypothetical protein